MREERKVVTALFADVVGSTALAERFDPEDVVEIVGRAVSLMVEVVEGFGGTVKDLAGDGVLALFGAPDAHEDDPERAVRAGLRIVEVIRAHEADVCRSWNVDTFGVRVGIETGLVVLGPVGGGTRVEYGATGDALNTAARLQSHADPYAVLVGPETHHLIEPLFRWGERRELEVKGKAEPVAAVEVDGVRSTPGKLRGLAGATAPLLGREAELRVALDAGAEVVGGRGGVLFVDGEPGVGKTRLVSELRSFVGGSVTWLDGQCVSYGQALPYWPFRDLLRGWLGATVADPPERLGDRLRERAGELLDQPDDVVPYLAAVLGVSLGADAERELAALSPEARAFRTTEAMRALVRALAADRPLILAIDDLQWADATSVQLLERLFPLADDEPALFVLALRRERDHPSWRLREDAEGGPPGRVHVVSLEALPANADLDLLHELVGEGTLPGDVERRIVRTAEGNPLYLEELVRSLVEAGSLVPEGDGWRFEPGPAIELPPTVERVIVSRIDRLSASARDTIHAASVLGRRFGQGLLEAVAGGTLTAALAELVSMDLLREEGSEYRFKHGLIQEACYQNMLKRRRRELHARAAEALESLLGDRPEPYYGVLAQHHLGAGDLEAALRWFELAADAAQRVYAVEAALDHYTSALRVAEELRSDRIPELLLRRGRVLGQAGQLASARRDFERALDAAREGGDRALEVEGMNELGFLLAGAVTYREALPLLERSLAAAEQIGSREAQVAAASRLSIVYTNLLHLDLAVERARRASALARSIGGDRWAAMAMDALQVASVMVGDMATVDEVSPALIAIHRQRGDLWYLQFAVYQWAWADVAAARWDAAERRFSEALEINRRIGDRANEPIMLSSLAWVARARGAYGPAIELARRAVEIAGEVGHAEFLAWSTQQLGWALLEVFDARGAAEYFARSLRTAEESGGRIEMVRAACHLPLARWLAGDRSRALEDAAGAERLLAETTAPPGQAYLQGADGPIALANLHIAAGAPARALDVVGPVWEAAVQAGWEEVAAGAALAIGRARVRLGPSDATDVLEAAAERAERAGLPGLAWRAHAELAAAGPPEARSVHRLRSAELIQALSASIGDASIRGSFVERATAELSGGGAG